MDDRQGNRGEVTVRHLLSPSLPDRRDFVKGMLAGGLALAASERVVRWAAAAAPSGKSAQFSMIIVDFGKCAGCRTCEAVCAQYNHKRVIDGEPLWGLGNPALANIRVHHFNPDVDVPVTCSMCRDNPCIQACPVDPDGQGRRAIYRDAKTLAIKSDPNRCIGCCSCAKACREQRSGIIVSNPDTRVPERMCTLCDGDPQCVKYCPYEALRCEIGREGKEYAAAAETIADELIARLYSALSKEGGAQP